MKKDSMTLAKNPKAKEGEENKHSRIKIIQTQGHLQYLFKQESKM